MTTRVTVRFAEIWQDRQDIGVNDEQVVSTVYFSIEADGREWQELEATVKQTAGADFEKEPLEVGLPTPYDEGAPMNYEAYRDCVETYYRSAFGKSGHAIHIAPGAQVRMRNNHVSMPMECSFDAG